MKAWLVREKDEFSATIIFAETRGKAKSLALGTECLENADFCNVEAYRVPQMDKYYKEGKTEMDWLDPKDRVAMVKECDLTCEYIDLNECKTCAAREICSQWEEAKMERLEKN